MNKVCPDCGGERFKVYGIQSHTWIVDGEGELLRDEGCYHAEIEDGSSWTCCECGKVLKQEDEQ